MLPWVECELTVVGRTALLTCSAALATAGSEVLGWGELCLPAARDLFPRRTWPSRYPALQLSL